MGQNGQSIRNYESFKLICICKYYARDFNARANLKGNPKPGRHWNRFFSTKVNCSRNNNQENIQNPILIEAAIFKN